MNDVIVIEMAGEGLTPVRIGQVSAGGEWLRTLAPDDLGSVAGAEAILILDGTTVTSHRVVVPDFPETKLQQILPGLMEAKQGQVGKAIHFACLSERDRETGERTVAAVEAETLSKAIASAEQLGLTVRAVVPDYLLLDAGQAATSPEGKTLYHSEGGVGFAAEAGLAAHMMPEGMQARELSSPEWRAVLGQAATVTASLLQGAFGPRAGLSVWMVWCRRAAILAVSAFALWAGMLSYQANQNFTQAERLHTAAESRFRAALPEVGRIVNMEAQMRRAVQSRREQGGSEFLILSSLVASVVADQDTTMLESMRFDAEAGTVAVSASFASFAIGEQFKAALQERGLEVTEGNSRSEGNRVLSELVIRRRT